MSGGVLVPLLLRGDAASRGASHGRALARSIRVYTDERVALASDGSWAGRSATREDMLALAEAMLPAHAAYSPELYAEMIAMAEAAGISAAEAVIVGGSRILSTRCGRSGRMRRRRTIARR
jgi:isopenicillin-N N-acyltransferase-like protein